MGCGNCGTNGCGPGCGRKGGCATGGCNKLNTYDWLGNMLPPDRSEAENVYEIRFKGTRKAFFRNANSLPLNIGDTVVVESDQGYDMGRLSLGGVMAELQMRRKRIRKRPGELPRIYRLASEEDQELMTKSRSREQATLARSRQIIQDMRLEMKLSDVEFQADNVKATFYYIADSRVDFRELIRVLARTFSIRIEMRQIGLRHEAGLVGGIGSCGRELCCATWLTDFKTVSTAAARYQNLSLNPLKISGQCGRLKCCLNFELDAYMDALKDFPRVNTIETAKGMARLEKTDIFKGMLWFSYSGETTWYPMTTDEVKRIIEMNKRGEKPVALINVAPTVDSDIEDLGFVDGVGTTRLREERRRGKGRGGRKKGQGQQQQKRKSQPRGEGDENKGPGNPQGKSSRRRGGRGRGRRPGDNRGRGPGRGPDGGGKQPPGDSNGGS